MGGEGERKGKGKGGEGRRRREGRGGREREGTLGVLPNFEILAMPLVKSHCSLVKHIILSISNLYLRTQGPYKMTEPCKNVCSAHKEPWQAPRRPQAIG